MELESKLFSRRAITKTALTLGIAGIVVPSFSRNSLQDQQPKPKPPPLPPELVREFVGAAHGDLEKTKKLLAEHPTIINAAWDWKNGDFEAAIGGSGHMGRRDIAEFLISQGAQTDLHVHAMMGDLDIVRTILTKYPHLKNSLGPHGITLLRHAEVAGAESKHVLNYLKSL